MNPSSVIGFCRWASAVLSVISAVVGRTRLELDDTAGNDNARMFANHDNHGKPNAAQGLKAIDGTS